MKTMVYIFFSFFMFCAMNLNAQSPIEIDTVSLRYVNGFTNQHEIVDEYRMTNHSNEEYILSSTYKCNFLGADNKQ